MKPVELRKTYLEHISRMDIPDDFPEIREELEELIVFDNGVFSSFSLSNDDKEILCEIGIPQEYQTGIVFEPDRAKIIEDKIRIGTSTNGGDDVFLKRDGSIILLNHDYFMEEVFIASNISCLFHFIIAFMENESPDLYGIDQGLRSNENNYWYTDRKYQP